MSNAHRTVTDRILAQLKAGTVPWVKPWKSTGATPATLPANAVTGRRYSGVNIWLLWMAAAEAGWANGRYLTFKQAAEAGGTVRRGEHGTKVYLVKRVEVADRENEGEKKNISLLREYTVFNIAQCDGLPERMVGATVPVTTATVDTASPFSDFMTSTQADIQHSGDRAMFVPSLDRIFMPPVEAFVDVDNYRATLAHELVHWTGVKDRCDRDMRGRFGDASYALEELVAELGSAIVCAEYGIVGQLQHADYIANWIKVLTDHDTAFFAAASAASKAVDYLQGLGAVEEEVRVAA